MTNAEAPRRRPMDDARAMMAQRVRDRLLSPAARLKGEMVSRPSPLA